MIKLSFIVPVYNVEKYLRKCVDSLLAQDYEDYEIILVDDGSTDNSPQICDDYAERAKSEELRGKSCSIKVVHRENGGLSAARNSGIEVAQGEYICFVDSDDYWQPNVLACLMAQIERDNLDVLRFDFQNVNEQYKIIHPNKAQKRELDLSESVTDGETFLSERLGPCCYAVMFILKKEILNLQSPISNVRFTEGIYFEDTDWTPRMLIRAKRVASTPTIVYNYLWRLGSITLPTDSAKREKLLRDKISLIYRFYEQQKLVQNPIWFTWMISFNTLSILDVLVSLPSKERNEYIAELKSLRVFPLSTHRTNCNERIKIWIANFSPNLYCNLMRLRK